MLQSKAKKFYDHLMKQKIESNIRIWFEELKKRLQDRDSVGDSLNDKKLKKLHKKRQLFPETIIYIEA